LQDNIALGPDEKATGGQEPGEIHIPALSIPQDQFEFSDCKA
jgi:hypothetical protein